MSTPKYRPYEYTKPYLAELDFAAQGLTVAEVTDFHPGAWGADASTEKAQVQQMELDIRRDPAGYNGVYVAATSYEEYSLWEALGWSTLTKKENQGGDDCWNMLKQY